MTDRCLAGRPFPAPQQRQTTGTCSNTLANGSSITLTAIPDSYSTFTGWTGACSGNGACTLTMDQAKTVGAVFTRRQVSLTLTLQGPGFGSVRVNEGYTCTLEEGGGEKECQTFVDLNRMVTLTALPGAEQTFSAFGGASSRVRSRARSPPTARRW